MQLPPRRETSRRAAKEKSNIQQLIAKQAQATVAGDADDPDEPVEFVDSDSDPAWTPVKVIRLIQKFYKIISLFLNVCLFLLYSFLN